MNTFLTSREMQELIGVDRSTVYRMAEDGRLPGLKVGRQWRFPADRVAAQLGITNVGEQTTRSAPDSDQGDRSDEFDLATLLRVDDAQSIADLIGEVFGVMAVITDMDGHPITEVANPCGYYTAIGDQPNAAEACLSHWQLFTEEPHVAPRWTRTHLGFLCARTFLWLDLKPVGMIIVGGVTPQGWPPPPEFVETIADELGVSHELLLDRVAETWDLDLAEQRRVVRLLPQFGDVVSQLLAAHRQSTIRADDSARRRAVDRFEFTAQPQVPQGGDRS